MLKSVLLAVILPLFIGALVWYASNIVTGAIVGLTIMVSIAAMPVPPPAIKEGDQ